MPPRDRPVLVLAPQGRDAEVAVAILGQAGLRAIACLDLQSLIDQLPEAACAVVAEEALRQSNREGLAGWIEAQAPWSDFPFLLLGSRRGAPNEQLLRMLGNVTVLERPFHSLVLVNAVRAASRARQRQYESARYLEEQRQSEALKELLIRELHHRVKNTFATVLALIRAPGSAEVSVADYRASLSARLMSLSHTHDQLLLNEWQSVPLVNMIRSELLPYGGDQQDRVQLLGPDVDLAAELAVPLGMIVHELATNAAKYGALSVPCGKLTLRWRLEANGSGPALHLSWDESDGPAVPVPPRRGFGTTLVKSLLAPREGASYAFDFRPSGLRFELAVPLGTGAQGVAPRGSPIAPTGPHAPAGSLEPPPTNHTTM